MELRHLKHDHHDLKSDLAALRVLARAGISAHAHEITERLFVMSAHIEAHLTLEDRNLYPTLAECGEPSVAAMAIHHRNEMNGFAEALGALVGRWGVGNHIGADSEGFRMDADPVLKALHDCLHREETEFFPAIERKLARAAARAVFPPRTVMYGW